MSVHFLASGALLLATAAAVSQAVQADIKPHWHTSEPRVVIPGEYDYNEEANAVPVPEVTLDSAEFIGKGKKAVIMRKESTLSASLLESERDLYVKVGNNLCDGPDADGNVGLWKRYEASGVVPGTYQYCAPLCDQKIECIGFDVGDTGCNLYTQKAVAIGSWPHVRSTPEGEAFAGQDSHDLYPDTPLQLNVGNSSFGVKRRFKCYRKSLFRPSTSYYRHLGHGECTGGCGDTAPCIWNRYKLVYGTIQTQALCEDACNLRDECVGFGFAHTHCYLYAQKEVFGTWPGVNMSYEEGTGAHEGRFPASLHDLSAGALSADDANNTGGASNAGSDHGACWGKVYWVALSSYYMKLGHKKCEGGGLWKHYKITGGDDDDCKKMCDETHKCVGLDFSSDGGTSECRLYVSEAYDGWSAASAEDGSGLHDLYVPDAFSLYLDENENEAAGTFCYAKTHHEPVEDHPVEHAKVGIE